MNRIHRWLCRSAHWQKTLEQRLPWVVDATQLGPNVLEVGPGPGLTTDMLRRWVKRITALEIDEKLADALRLRLQGTNVEVVQGDATAMPFPDGKFSAGVSFTMLHHVPSAELQDKLLREAARVLVPGGIFAGCDSRQSWMMRVIHVGDTLVPVNPDTLGRRLEAAGFEAVEIEKKKDVFRFRARRAANGK